MKRSDLTTDSYDNEDMKTIEYYEMDSVISYIDDIESRVNTALGRLKSISSVGDLCEVETVLDELEELSKDLY